MITGRVGSIPRTTAISPAAISGPPAIDASGTSLPIDHSTTAGEFLAACTISAMSRALHSSKSRW